MREGGKEEEVGGLMNEEDSEPAAYFGFFTIIFLGFFNFINRKAGSSLRPINGGDVTSCTINTYSPVAKNFKIINGKNHS